MEEALSKPAETKEKVVTIEEPLHRHLDGITPIQQVLDVIKSLHRITEETSETDHLTGMGTIFFHLGPIHTKSVLFQFRLLNLRFGL